MVTTGVLPLVLLLRLLAPILLRLLDFITVSVRQVSNDPRNPGRVRDALTHVPEALQRADHQSQKLEHCQWRYHLFEPCRSGAQDTRFKS